MAPSRNVRRQYRIKFDEDRFRTVEIAAAHRAHAPFEEKLATRERRYAIVRIERGCIATFSRLPSIHFRQKRRERSKRVYPRIGLCQFFTQYQRLAIAARRLQQRRLFHMNLLHWMSGRECLIEKLARFREPMESLGELCANIERPCGIRRQCSSLGGHYFGAVMVHDTTEHVTAKKQKLRQRD